MFTSQVIQQNTFLIIRVGIWWRHETWIFKILKSDFLENEKSFWSEIKNIFPIWQVLSFRLKKQTSKNVANTTFKGRNFRDKKILRNKFSREEIFPNLPLIRENKFREIYQKFSIRENFFRDINQKYPFAKITSAKNDIFPNKFSWSRIVFYTINGGKSKQIQNHQHSNYTILLYYFLVHRDDLFVFHRARHVNLYQTRNLQASLNKVGMCNKTLCCSDSCSSVK